MTAEARLFTPEEVRLLAEQVILLTQVAGAARQALMRGVSADGRHYDVKLTRTTIDRILAAVEVQP